MIICGYYRRGDAKLRTKATKALARELGVAASDVHMSPSFVDALALAVDTPEQATVVGAMVDLEPPADRGDIDRVIWRESAIALMSERGVAYRFLDLSEAELDRMRKAPPAQVIRQYNEALTSLRQALQHRSKEALAKDNRKIGRPPYGYLVKEGRLAIHPERAEAISLIFSLLRGGKLSFYQIEEEVRKKFGTICGKNEFWDYVKLRRIVSKARLYCLGEYESGGQTYQYPDLAFLPPEWADTTWTSPIVGAS